MIIRIDWFVRSALLAIAFLLAAIALRPLYSPGGQVLAQTARFDHVEVISPVFLYKGLQGLLVLDRRNGNIWFIPKGNEHDTLRYLNPLFVSRVPFEKLDETPR